MSASPVKMALEIRSPVTGQWSDFERGEHEVADFLLGPIQEKSLSAIDARCRLAMGRYVEVVGSDGIRYECRFTPEAWLQPDNSSAES